MTPNEYRPVPRADVASIADNVRSEWAVEREELHWFGRNGRPHGSGIAIAGARAAIARRCFELNVSPGHVAVVLRVSQRTVRRWYQDMRNRGFEVAQKQEQVA